jgi:hypothetical protein
VENRRTDNANILLYVNVGTKIRLPATDAQSVYFACGLKATESPFPDLMCEQTDATNLSRLRASFVYAEQIERARARSCALPDNVSLQ